MFVSSGWSFTIKRITMSLITLNSPSLICNSQIYILWMEFAKNHLVLSHQILQAQFATDSKKLYDDEEEEEES